MDLDRAAMDCIEGRRQPVGCNGLRFTVSAVLSGRVADESPATLSPATSVGGAAPDRTSQTSKSDTSGNAGTAAEHVSLTGSAAVPDDDIAIPAFLWRAG